MKRIFFLFLWISASIFSQENPLQYVDFFNINDVDFSVFENPKYAEDYAKVGDKNQFFQRYFKVWNDKNQSVSDIEYKENFTYRATEKSPCIGENYNPLSNEIISEIQDNINIDKSSIGKNIQLGITVKTADIRILPTNEVCFKNVRNAGEGFPFDYFQNSTLWLATPVSILATSNDGLWYFINSHNNKGWVKTEEIALINEEEANRFQKMDFLTPIDDKVVVKGEFESKKVYIGSVFATNIKDDDTSKILIPKKNNKNQVEFEYVSVSTNNFKSFPIQFNANNVKHILTELYHYKYTWGGLNAGRDCSSTLKDFYAPFGLWLPRNSGQQKVSGKTLKLKGTNLEKLTKVLVKGVPFLSTIYKRGHIVLYLGFSKEKIPLIFQNVWGIKAYYNNKTLANYANKREQFGLFGIHNKEEVTNTRFIIGKAVITTIEPSKRLNDFKGLTTESFLENFNMLTLFIQK